MLGIPLHFNSFISECTPFSINLEEVNHIFIKVLTLTFKVISELWHLHFSALSKTAASILESILKRDPHEAEFIQSIQEVVHSLEPVLVKNSQ